MATTTLQRPDRMSWLQLVLATVIWGGLFAVGKHLGRELAPLAATFARYGGASLILVPLAYADAATVRRADWSRLLGIGLLSSVAFNVLVFWGLRYAPAGDGALTPAAIPLFMALVGWLWQGRTPSRRAWAFLGLSLLGLGVLMAANLQAPGMPMRPVGDALLLAAAMAWVGYLTLQQTVTDRYSPRLLTAITGLVGAVVALPLAVAEGSLGAMVHLSLGAWLDVAYFAVFGTAVAFLLWSSGLRHLGPVQAASVMNLVPVWGVVIAVVVVGEPLGMRQLLGMVLMLLGVLGYQRSDRARVTAPSSTGSLSPIGHGERWPSMCIGR